MKATRFSKENGMWYGYSGCTPFETEGVDRGPTPENKQPVFCEIGSGETAAILIFDGQGIGMEMGENEDGMGNPEWWQSWRAFDTQAQAIAVMEAIAETATWQQICWLFDLKDERQQPLPANL